MIRNRFAAASAVVVSLFALSACDNGLLSLSSGDGATVDAQVAHRSSAVVQALSVRSAGDRALVSVRILNGRDREMKFDAGTDHSYIVTDTGEKLMLVKSATNADLEIPPGKMMDGTLIFAGKLPTSGSATMILNAHDGSSNPYTLNPRIEISLPLSGSRGGSVPEKSELANMRTVPMSKFAAAAGGGSTFNNTGQSASNLQAVDELRSKLGAVETDRGTLVSLPGDVTFDFDKATVRSDAKSTLDQLAALISAGGGGEISIEGHTDAKGDDAYNKRLSQDRAEAVREYLVAKGIDKARLRTIGLGELRPVAPNAKSDGSDDEKGRQSNRRVEVILPKLEDEAINQSAR
ncbi:MAG: OmpA family protein [Alphaproteobacteria bacterium]|nr:MAG: OmpA family protein [Alphaproteobacteria bacterium]